MLTMWFEGPKDGNITVGRSGTSGPSGQSMSREPSIVRRVGIPAQEVQAHTSSIDDDFEL